MEKEQYNNLLNRIKKQYPKFKLIGIGSKKENKRLEFVEKDKKKIIGWSHKNENNLIFGCIEKNSLIEIGEADFRNLKEVFEKTEELVKY